MKKSILFIAIAALSFVACEKEAADVPGCTDQTALNYDAAATVDNGSCTYPEPPEVYNFQVAALDNNDYDYNANVVIQVFDTDNFTDVFHDWSDVLNPHGTSNCDMTVENDGTTVTEGVEYQYIVRESVGGTQILSGNFQVDGGVVNAGEPTVYQSGAGHAYTINYGQACAGKSGVLLVIRL